MWRKAVEKGVAKKRHNWEENQKEHEAFLEFVALGLYPAQLIRRKFEELKTKVLTVFKNWQRFVTYYEDTWINGFTPEMFSVYGKFHRTNNAIEAYHKVLNSLISSTLNAEQFLCKYFKCIYLFINISILCEENKFYKII